VKFVIYNVRMI